ncbi:MAG TPA: 50S ribosomal protein L10 [Chthonomonadaceae bacterium]|nr:50S ribosomal protein L10 [Chthonomonadaceae bacterium]
MPNPQKEETVAGLRELIAGSKGAILTDYRGLTVAEVTTLRRKLRESSAEYHIVKNTLFRRALGGEISPELDKLLSGPTAIVFAQEDIVAPAKAMLDFAAAAKKPDVKVKGGYLDGKVYDLAQVTTISKLPPKPQIMAQIIGSINGPASSLVGTINAVLSELVRTVQLIADQKAGAGAAEA